MRHSPRRLGKIISADSDLEIHFIKWIENQAVSEWSGFYFQLPPSWLSHLELTFCVCCYMMRDLPTFLLCKTFNHTPHRTCRTLDSGQVASPREYAPMNAIQTRTPTVRCRIWFNDQMYCLVKRGNLQNGACNLISSIKKKREYIRSKWKLTEPTPPMYARLHQMLPGHLKVGLWVTWICFL